MFVKVASSVGSVAASQAAAGAGSRRRKDSAQPGTCRIVTGTVQHSTVQYSTVQYSTVQTCLIAAARLWSPEGTPADSTLSDTLNNNTWRRCGYDRTAAVWTVVDLARW